MSDEPAVFDTDEEPNEQGPPSLAEQYAAQAQEARAEQRFTDCFGCTIDEALSWTFDQARRRTRDLVQAEDIAQQALLKLWIRSAGGPLEVNSVEAYIRGTVNNLIATLWTKAKREREVHGHRVDYDIAMETRGDNDVERDVLDSSLVNSVTAAIAELPDKLRAVVDLLWDPRAFDFNARPQSEVARILGINPGTVKSRLFTARNLLAEHRWKMLGDDPSAPDTDDDLNS
ncbi:RNA polymerase sigma factor [Nocardia arizonensis]|uniref:RNA polymerase sigma factor n=1 Tax=Nocardia arizonensis TaxID=1141647 RepID=UPI0006D0439D|nr:RNA polymerase sigma factor [Nocardia arizonensis]